MFYNNYDIKTIDGEVWLPIYGYEGYYEISNFGRVKRLVSYGCWKERILKQNAIIRNGKPTSCQVRLSVESIKKNHLVHRLVGFAFLINENNYPQILHEDDNPFNNTVLNLRWGTQKQNIQDCHKRGRASFNLPKDMSGINNPNFGKKNSYKANKQTSMTKRVISDELISVAINAVKQKELTLRKAALKYKISPSYLCLLVNNKASRLKY